MNPVSTPDRLVTRRLRALARALPAAVDGEPTGVHKARVATRRLREALPVALADIPRRRSRKLRRAFRRITRALGPVRELDVALALVTDLQGAEPQPAPALEAVRLDIEDDRRDRRERMLVELGDLDFERLIERLGHAADRRAGERRSGHAAATVLASRLARRARTLRQTVGAAGTLYAPEAIHDVRIAAKKLRYALELAADMRLIATRRPAERLKRAQEILGRLHDRQVLIDRVHRVQAHVPPQDRATRDDLVAIADRLERDCRELHAAYVLERDKLTAVAEAALDGLATPPCDTDPAVGATIH